MHLDLHCTGLALILAQQALDLAGDARDPRRIEVPGTSIELALWSQETAEGSTPFFSISLDGEELSVTRETSYEILLDRASFDPELEEPDLADSLLSGGGELHLVQFVTQPLEAFREGIRALGGRIGSYVPHHAYVVRMDDACRARVEALPYVRWVGEYHPEYRVERGILEGLADGSLAPWQRYQIMLVEQSEAEKAVLAARVAEIGGEVVQLDRGSSFLQVFLTPEQLRDIAGADQVLYLDRLGEYEPDMDVARELHGSLWLENLTGWDGEGVRGESADIGCETTHPDLQLGGPPVCHDTSGGGCGSSFHGTAVHGIVFGSGLACQRGILRAHEADFYCTTQAWVGSSGSPGTSPGGRWWHTGELVDPALDWRCVFQTNSTGSPRTTLYTTVSAQMDQAILDHDIVICQANGNSGNAEGRPQAWAKNVVSVGGINHGNTLTKADDTWAFGASTGPATDGRIEPDLASFYDLIDTTTTGGACTASFGGTSGATPIVAAHLGLVFQMWHEGLFGNLTGGSVFDSRCHFTTARALAINSAAQWTFSGAGHDLTRVNQGWGHPDVRGLYEARDRMRIVDEADVLGDLESTTWRVEVQPGEPALKATLIYADAPGAPAVQAQHRVNDLSLKLVSPGGTTWWGNHGLLAEMWSSPGGARNDKDTVENVYVQAPEPGTWSVTVSADEINADTHLETARADADYALVVSGVADGGVCDDPRVYCTAKPTSIATLPAIGWLGSPSAGNNHFGVTVSGMVPNKPAIAFWGSAPNSLPFQGGWLCVLPPIQRGTPLQLDPAGSGQWPIDLGGQLPGSRQFYQAWGRDPADPTGYGTSLSDALEVTFCD